MKIRPFKNSDQEALLELFCTTIKEVNSKDYSEKQISLWGSKERLEKNWSDSFKNKNVWVAENDKELLGFCELTAEGYIDRFYCSSSAVGKGVGKQLYEELEKHARIKSISRLTVAASITAKDFFRKLGFNVVREQTVFIQDTPFINFYMEKDL